MNTPNQYARRDSEGLGEYYTRHVEAMTAEALHSKADIAAELAWRDEQIDQLKDMLQKSPVFVATKCAGDLGVEVWGDMSAAVASAKLGVESDGTTLVVPFYPPTNPKSRRWEYASAVFAAVDGEINFEPPTVPGMRPFRMVYDDALLKVGTLIAWLGADSKLYPARITNITSPSGMIMIKEDAPDSRATSIWIENIKFIRP